MKKISITVFYICIITFSYSQSISLETIATGFNNPINIKNAGDSRLFVVEQAGYIRIINSDGTVNPTAFLNIDGIVSNSGGERGLLGLAFHPNYASNGYFYVNYINNSGNTVISRFSRDLSNPNIANPASELQLLTFTQPYSNHNGGDLAFGADGYLYIASGDGGSAGDPGDRAQSLNTLLGKILRLDVDNTSNGNNYAIPADNPFFGSTSSRQEIWAYGLRNPWKFSFDRTTNDLWIGDVGQNAIEEINMVASTASGINYGWRCYEGNTVYNTSGNCPEVSTLTFPVAQYPHSGSGPFKCSITGGYRYRGSAQPTLAGIYFFADYCSNQIGLLQPSGTSWNLTFTPAFNGNSWTTFGEGNDGEIYIAGNGSDTVYRIIDSNLGIEDNDLFEVQLYPNPTNDYFNIELVNSNQFIDSISIYDIHGKKLLSINDVNNQITQISTRKFSNGIYFVELKNVTGGKIIKKLIKN